jgi:hypothetical protein
MGAWFVWLERGKRRVLVARGCPADPIAVLLPLAFVGGWRSRSLADLLPGLAQPAFRDLYPSTPLESKETMLILGRRTFERTTGVGILTFRKSNIAIGYTLASAGSAHRRLCPLIHTQAIENDALGQPPCSDSGNRSQRVSGIVLLGSRENGPIVCLLVLCVSVWIQATISTLI